MILRACAAAIYTIGTRRTPGVEMMRACARVSQSTDCARDTQRDPACFIFMEGRDFPECLPAALIRLAFYGR